MILAGSVFAATGLGDMLADEGGERITFESTHAARLIDERIRGDAPAVPEEFVII